MALTISQIKWMGGAISGVAILLVMVGIFFALQPTQEDTWFFYGNRIVGNIALDAGIAMGVVGFVVAVIGLRMKEKKGV